MRTPDGWDDDDDDDDDEDEGGQRACEDIEIRTAMIAQGVPDRCLPPCEGQRTEDELRSLILAIGKEGPGTLTFLRLMAAARGLPELPRGNELEDFAAQYGISRRAVYRAVEPVRSASPAKQRATGTAGGQTRLH